MARIKFTALVESIRGSIAGTTFQRNAYGYSVKAKPNIVNPNTQAQSVSKQKMQAISKHWQSMSAAQRASWASYAAAYPVAARLNPSSNLDGYAYFLRYHLIRFGGDSSFLDTTPISASTFEFIESELTTAGGNLFLSVVIDSDSDTWNLNVYMSPPVPASRSVLRITPKFMLADNGGYDDPWDLTVTSYYEALYGSIPSLGQSVGIRLAMFEPSVGQAVIVPSYIQEVTA